MAEGFSIADAIVAISGDSSKLNAELALAQRKGETFVAQMKTTLGGLAGIIIPGGIALAITQIGMSALDSAERLQHLSEQTGIGVHALSQWEFVGKMFGVSIEQITMAMSRLGRQMINNQDEFGAASNAFRASGLSATDAAGNMKTLDSMMLDVADKFKQLGPGASANALAIQLFGRSGKELIPVLLGGREELERWFKAAEDAGVTLDGRTTQAALRFKQEMYLLEAQLQGFVRRTLMEMIDGFGHVQNILKDNSGQVDIAIPHWLSFGQIIRGLVSVVELTVAEFKAMGITMAFPAQVAGEMWEALRGRRPWSMVGSDIKAFWNQMGADLSALTDKTVSEMSKQWIDADQKIAQEEKNVAQGLGLKDVQEQIAAATAKEHTLQLQLQTAEYSKNWQEVLKLKLQLADLHGEILRLQSKTPEQDVTAMVNAEKAKALAEVAHAQETANLEAQRSITTLQVEEAKRRGDLVAIEQQTEAEIALAEQKMREQGVNEALIAQYDKMARLKMRTDIISQSQAALSEVAKFQNEIDKEMVKNTETGARAERDAAGVELEQRLQDYAAFLEKHEGMTEQVENLRKHAMEEYNQKLLEIDQKYSTDWRDILHRAYVATEAESDNTAKAIEGFMKKTLDTMNNDLGAVFFDTLTGNFNKAREEAKKFFTDLLNEILHFLAQQAVQRLINLFVSYYGSSAMTLPSSGVNYAAMIHSAEGNVFSKPSVTSIAESGPEAVIPLKGGAVPVQLSGGSRSGKSEHVIKQTIIIAPELLQAMKTSPEEIITTVGADLARNGQLRRTLKTKAI